MLVKLVKIIKNFTKSTFSYAILFVVRSKIDNKYLLFVRVSQFQMRDCAAEN